MDDRIVSHCPVCAAPVYGRESLSESPHRPADTPPAPARFSCDCRRHLTDLLAARADEHRARADMLRHAGVLPPGRLVTLPAPGHEE